jgi:AcrR family transcriptional regulator
MPPPVVVTKPQVLDAAFEVVRAHGLSRLTARSVAKALGCSTQPVYRAYASMALLQADVFQRATAVAMEFLKGDPADPPFMAVGFGYLRFAQQEPHLFRLVTQAAPVVRDLVSGGTPSPFMMEQMRRLPDLAPLSDEQLQRIHNLLWFFSQGIVSVFSANLGQDPMPMARALLAQAGQAVIAWERSQAVTPPQDKP